MTPRQISIQIWNANNYLGGRGRLRGGTFIPSSPRAIFFFSDPNPRLLVFTPLSTIAGMMTMAPKLEIYTLLACSVHKPEIFRDRQFLPSYIPSYLQLNTDPIDITFPPSFDIAFNNGSSKTTECAADPVVLAAVARLTTAISTSMGVLGCLTTGWWGAFSDRYGRSRIFGLTIMGVLLNDLNFIFVAKNFRHIFGGYWFLIVGPLIEGALGGRPLFDFV